MPRDMERAVIDLVRKVYGGREKPTPDWLQRPGRAEARRRWTLVRDLYAELTGMELPEVMPPRERRTMDCVLQRSGEPPRIIEFDETQHFNHYRAMTIHRYPRSVHVAFDRHAWLAACDAKTRLEGGRFGKPKPPLFPHADGRQRQRAYRDALVDVLPAVHGWLPTLRIDRPGRRSATPATSAAGCKPTRDARAANVARSLTASISRRCADRHAPQNAL